MSNTSDNQWNYNMGEVSKSYIKGKVHLREGKLVSIPTLVPKKIIAAMNGKTLVTVTYWLPNEDRCCMSAHGQVPICWMPWPEYPYQ